MTEPSSPNRFDPTLSREMEDRIRARMQALEADTHRLRRQVRVVGLGLAMTLALLGLAVFGPGWVGADAGGPVVEARAFRLVDAEGVVRGEWQVDGEGAARLSLMDTRREPRLNLAVLESGFPGLALINEAGQRRAVLGLLPDQTTTLVFADAAGVPRAVFGLTRADEANLVFADAEGVTRLGMGLAGDGVGSVLMPQDTLAAETGGGTTDDGSTP